MKAALVLIDLQNDYLSATGLQPASSQIISGAATLLEACRDKGIPVIHVITTTHRDPDDRMPHWKQSDRWMCEVGTVGHESPAALRPVDGETIVHKQFFSGFSHAALEAALRAHDCDAVIVTGIHLHACVRATALDAYQRGYSICVAEDAVGSDDAIHAAITRRYLAERSIQFAPAAEILAGLANAAISPRTSFQHRSPRETATVLFEVQIAGKAEVARATTAARTALPAWKATSMADRAQSLRKLADLLVSQSTALAQLITDDVGKPIAMARAEVQRSAAILHAVAERAGEELAVQSAPGASYRYQPLGVVAAVTPWNNPLAIPIGRIAPALMYGNTVVWKPAPAGTRIAQRLLELSRAAGWQAGTKDVLYICTGDHSTASAVAADPRIDGLTLSGSLHAGYALQEICARRHVPFQAELGGNNAAIVWEDADLAHAARQITAGAIGFAGQRCTANRRVVVAESVFAPFVEQLQAAALAMNWGDPLDEKTVIGPLQTFAKREQVSSLIDRARATGLRLLVPHSSQDNYQQLMSTGAFYPPTIVIAEDPNHEIVQEETFGPVLVVQRAGQFDRAIDLANGVRQGLVAALFSHNPALQEQFLAEARAGVLKLNSSTADADAASPLGGWKASGIGPAEHGPSDREFFCRVQTIYKAQA